MSSRSTVNSDSQSGTFGTLLPRCWVGARKFSLHWFHYQWRHRRLDCLHVCPFLLAGKWIIMWNWMICASLVRLSPTLRLILMQLQLFPGQWRLEARLWQVLSIPQHVLWSEPTAKRPPRGPGCGRLISGAAGPLISAPDPAGACSPTVEGQEIFLTAGSSCWVFFCDGKKNTTENIHNSEQQAFAAPCSSCFMSAAASPFQSPPHINFLSKTETNRSSCQWQEFNYAESSRASAWLGLLPCVHRDQGFAKYAGGVHLSLLVYEDLFNADVPAKHVVSPLKFRSPIVR